MLERADHLLDHRVETTAPVGTGVQDYTVGADRIGDAQRVHDGIDGLPQLLRILRREVREVDVVEPHLDDPVLLAEFAEPRDGLGLVVGGPPHLRRAGEDLNGLRLDRHRAFDRREYAARA